METCFPPAEPVSFCVVTDILMPEMDGYRLCQAIRADEKRNPLPIILYTATYLSPGDEQLALDAGGDVYMRNPAPVETLCAAIRDLTKEKRTKRQSEPGDILKQYSETLIRKLEERNSQLQHEEEKFRQITETIQEGARSSRLEYAILTRS